MLLACLLLLAGGQGLAQSAACGTDLGAASAGDWPAAAGLPSATDDGRIAPATLHAAPVRWPETVAGATAVDAEPDPLACGRRAPFRIAAVARCPARRAPDAVTRVTRSPANRGPPQA